MPWLHCGVDQWLADTLRRAALLQWVSSATALLSKVVARRNSYGSRHGSNATSWDLFCTIHCSDFELYGIFDRINHYASSFFVRVYGDLAPELTSLLLVVISAVFALPMRRR